MGARDGAAPWPRDAVFTLFVKLAACAAVLAAGFEAVSDDDDSRVVIAEEWALSPRFDASGTSWLPLPFWVAGAAMRVFGRGLGTARLVAVVLGALSALLVLAAARRVFVRAGGALAPHAALAGALVAAVFPWSARLGVATVPELGAAALGLFAVATAAPDASARARLAGAVAIGAACLCRYDLWPLAALFAVVALFDAALAPSSRVAHALAAPLALAAPALWMAWNRHAHGDALHFLARVTAYRRAVAGGEGDVGPFERLVAYPVAMARAEPELFALLALGVVALAFVDRPALARALRAALRPAVLVGAQLLALALAMVKDGAPTHHPERATLLALLLAAVLAGAFVATAIARALAARPAAARLAPLAAVAPAAALVVATSLGRPPERAAYAQRTDARAIGLALAPELDSGGRALLEVADYGYFAVLAASGRPEAVALDRSIDPRRPAEASSFASAESLARRLADVRPAVVVARVPQAGAPPLLGRAPDVARGAWGLWRVGPPSP